MKYEISYGMYLYHFIVINALIHAGNADGVTVIIIVVLTAIVMGIVENVLFLIKLLSKINIR